MSVKVLIVDDSAIVRKTLSIILESDPEIDVLGTASDPYQAVEIMRKSKPDVITLDLEMPRMDGLTFLKRIMSQHPIPVVICSSLAQDGCETTLKALEYGAIDIITKPQLGTQEFLEEARIMICDAVKAAALVTPRKMMCRPPVRPKLSADAILAKGRAPVLEVTTQKVIAVGASTGGTEALSVFLQMMPENAPGIVVVQHMPEQFTRSFAERLNSFCSMTVKEAANQDTVMQGGVLIAPGGKHILLKRSGARYYTEVREGPLVNRHRPSVDVLFRSAARYAGRNAVGVILTGMGDDGARGMKELHDTGAQTLAQNEETCVVFGMPGEAIAAGGVDRILPLRDLAAAALHAAR